MQGHYLRVAQSGSEHSVWNGGVVRSNRTIETNNGDYLG
jgi:hypothetical protein